MKTSLIVSLIAGAVISSSALAQSPTTAPVLLASATVQPALTRAQVKQETRLAEISYQIPRGQANWPSTNFEAPSNLSRATVKAEARVAESRQLIARGQQAFNVSSNFAPSTLTRAEVKVDTRQAERAHLIPRGEANNGE
jgi:hypothetical protein